MTISLCKHRFPLIAPAGSLFRPVDCTNCGLTFAASQTELERQAEQIRLHTAREGHCEYCTRSAVVFQFQREAMPWDLSDPPVHWLCMGCWGEAAQTADGLTYSEISAALDSPQANPFARFVFGGAA
ncbi:hypothetical protein ACFRCX_30740 [Streptomyces sp. NPDC056652]|uniref:hypothetical protein n=1 Tax=Streptomyces sp. NPDC056652 TaxID=3345893 RepID=UPI0036BAA884